MIYAASKGDLIILRSIKDKSLLVKSDYDKRTPLHLAASNGQLKTIKYMIEEAQIKEISPVDNWGNTPTDDALREN